MLLLRYVLQSPLLAVRMGLDCEKKPLQCICAGNIMVWTEVTLGSFSTRLRWASVSLRASPHCGAACAVC